MRHNESWIPFCGASTTTDSGCVGAATVVLSPVVVWVAKTALRTTGVSPAGAGGCQAGAGATTCDPGPSAVDNEVGGAGEGRLPSTASRTAPTSTAASACTGPAAEKSGNRAASNPLRARSIVHRRTSMVNAAHVIQHKQARKPSRNVVVIGPSSTPWTSAHV